MIVETITAVCKTVFAKSAGLRNAAAGARLGLEMQGTVEQLSSEC
jgi:hypothetical protein